MILKGIEMALKVKKSVCTNLVFPRTRKDIGEFARAARFLNDRGIDSMEFYYDGENAQKTAIGKILEENGMEGIYIGVIPAKEQKLHACSTNKENRRAAVEMFCTCIDEAEANGIQTLMINSGSLGANVQDGLAALRETLVELYGYIAKKGCQIRLTLEPGDSWMYAKQLLGPAARTAAFLKACHREGLPLELTMDSAHSLEEGEDFVEAVKTVKPFCSHIHFANCYIKNSTSSLYGDQHLGFEYPDTEWDYSVIEREWPKLAKIYAGEELRVAIEVLCREENPYEYFDSMWDKMPYKD